MLFFSNDLIFCLLVFSLIGPPRQVDCLVQPTRCHIGMEKISLKAFSKETITQLACFFLYTFPFVLNVKHESCESHFEVFGKNSTQGLSTAKRTLRPLHHPSSICYMFEYALHALLISYVFVANEQENIVFFQAQNVARVNQ